MLQGGDPTGQGKGGQSIWGEPFPDEVRQTLKVGLVCLVAEVEVWTGTEKGGAAGNYDVQLD